MNAQTLKDEGIDLDRGTKAVDAILHSNGPEPAPKPRATRSDKGTKRPAKVEAEPEEGKLTPAQYIRLSVLNEDVEQSLKRYLEAEMLMRKAHAARQAYLDELQGK